MDFSIEKKNWLTEKQLKLRFLKFLGSEHDIGLLPLRVKLLITNACKTSENYFCRQNGGIYSEIQQNSANFWQIQNGFPLPHLHLCNSKNKYLFLKKMAELKKNF